MGNGSKALLKGEIPMLKRGKIKINQTSEILFQQPTYKPLSILTKIHNLILESSTFEIILMIENDANENDLLCLLKKIDQGLKKMMLTYVFPGITKKCCKVQLCRCLMTLQKKANILHNIVSTYIIDVMWGRPIKLIQVASNSEFRENQWNDLLFFEIVPSHCFGASEVQT